MHQMYHHNILEGYILLLQHGSCVPLVHTGMTDYSMVQDYILHLPSAYMCCHSMDDCHRQNHSHTTLGPPPHHLHSENAHVSSPYAEAC